MKKTTQTQQDQDISPEDIEDIRQAEEVLQRIRSGQEKTYSLEDVERELGLDNWDDKKFK